MPEFIHLHCHTEYSLLDGAIRIKDLCKRAKDHGMNAAAITDHGNLFGALDFYTTAKEFGIKPIIGCEVYVAHSSRHDKKSKHAKTRYHLILLAQNITGYKNLLKLVTLGFTEGYYYKPRVDKEILQKYNEGIIALSACLAGEIPRILMDDYKEEEQNSEEFGEGDPDKGGMQAAIEMAEIYSKIFPGRFYLELQENGLEKQKILNSRLIELADHTGLPLVATNDCHYLNKDDVEAHDILLCIQTQNTINDKNRMRFETRELYYKKPEEMEQAFSHIPQALENTLLIADQCDLDLDLKSYHFPKYEPDSGNSLETELKTMAEAGLKERIENSTYKIDPTAYKERLEKELKVICDMGFAGYFLIVQDFINWAKKQNIPVGPGRGSAAGSLVAWALKITDLDPIPYNLLFERFLNSERISMPDIDVDFCERRRSEVINYVAEKYGEDSVAQITTFGKMKARAVVRDVGRALGMSYAETDRIAKLIPEDPKMTIDKAMDDEPELKNLYISDKNIKKLIDISKKLEGLNRHASTHAAGVVISDKPMVEYLPLYRGKNNEIVSQFDMKMVEKTGLVKFDFLGLRTMTLIQDTLDLIKAAGEKVPDMSILPLDDPKVYELYSRGDTTGIFQVESEGMRSYLKMLHPTVFEDLIAMLALYRPGPLNSGMVDEFIKRKHGEVEVNYPLPQLEECLKDTYGVIVYQEQVMQIARIVAGYSLGEADLLRRAMGKKKMEEMAKQRINFVKGAKQNDVDEKKANEIFDLMEKFAAFGFNKSNSAAYALLSYFTAYLKVHYPVEFMAALLTSEMDDAEKTEKNLDTCKDMNITVPPPNIHLSKWTFTVLEKTKVPSNIELPKETFARYDKAILFGLGPIKNLGEEAVKQLTSEREKNGSFVNLLDLCTRLDSKCLNKRALEMMIKAGATDGMGEKRSVLFANLDKAISLAQKKDKEKSSGQSSLLDMDPKTNTSMPGLGFSPEEDIPEWNEKQKLLYEKEALGFYLTNPLSLYKQDFSRLNAVSIEDAQNYTSGSEIKMPVLISQIKEYTDKNGRKMALCQMEDLSGKGECIFFADSYEKYKELLKQKLPLLIEGELGHPLEDYQPDLTRLGVTSIKKAKESNPNEEIKLAVRITNIYKNKEYCQCQMDDLSSYGKFTFPINEYDTYKNLLKKDELFLIKGKLDTSQNGKNFSLKLTGACLLSDACHNCKEPVYLDMSFSQPNEKNINQLKDLCKKYPGQAPVVIKFKDNKKKNLSQSIATCPNFYKEFNKLKDSMNDEKKFSIEERKIIVNEALLLSEACRNCKEPVHLNVTDLNEQKIDRLKDLFHKFPGEAPVFINFEEDGKIYTCKMKYKIGTCPDFYKKINKLKETVRKAKYDAEARTITFIFSNPIYTGTTENDLKAAITYSVTNAANPKGSEYTALTADDNVASAEVNKNGQIVVTYNKTLADVKNITFKIAADRLTNTAENGLKEKWTADVEVDTTPPTFSIAKLSKDNKTVTFFFSKPIWAGTTADDIKDAIKYSVTNATNPKGSKYKALTADDNVASAEVNKNGQIVVNYTKPLTNIKDITFKVVADNLTDAAGNRLKDDGTSEHIPVYPTIESVELINDNKKAIFSFSKPICADTTSEKIKAAITYSVTDAANPKGSKYKDLTADDNVASAKVNENGQIVLTYNNPLTDIKNVTFNVVDDIITDAAGNYLKDDGTSYVFEIDTNVPTFNTAKISEDKKTVIFHFSKPIWLNTNAETIKSAITYSVTDAANPDGSKYKALTADDNVASAEVNENGQIIVAYNNALANVKNIIFKIAADSLTDAAGNGLNAEGTSDVFEIDTNAPTFKNAELSEDKKTVILSFSKPIWDGTITEKIKAAITYSVTDAANPDGSKYTALTADDNVDSAEINEDGQIVVAYNNALANVKNIIFKIAADSLTDAAGNGLNAEGTSDVFEIDTTAPTFKNAELSEDKKTVIFNFSKPIWADTITEKIKAAIAYSVTDAANPGGSKYTALTADDNVASAEVNENGQIVVAYNNALANVKNITFKIAPDSLTDAAGKGLNAEGISDVFEIDTTAPTFNNAELSEDKKTVIFSFSKPIWAGTTAEEIKDAITYSVTDAANPDGSEYTALSADDNLDSAEINENGQIVLTYTKALAKVKNITFKIAAGCVTDTAGNSLKTEGTSTVFNAHSLWKNIKFVLSLLKRSKKILK